jgi:hypothetical protein
MRMLENGLDATDVQQVIGTGRIVDHSLGKGQVLWRYVFEGNTVDGAGVRVVIEVNGKVIVVTVVALG